MFFPQMTAFIAQCIERRQMTNNKVRKGYSLEVEFVTPVTHGGSVKFLASGVNFSRNNAIYNINEST